MTILDVLGYVFSWLLLIFFGGQAIIFVGLVLWTVWTDAIKPRLIPTDDIARVADEIISRYPDPELEAFARYERAWYNSDGAEQTYWRRLWKAVRRWLEGRCGLLVEQRARDHRQRPCGEPRPRVPR